MANILIVESYPPLGALYREEFQDEGHRVFLVQNDKEAIEIASREYIDIAIIDEQIPDLEAEALIKEFKKQHPYMRGSVCSVNELSTKSYVTLCEESYTKSSDFEQLEAKVRKILSSK